MLRMLRRQPCRILNVSKLHGDVKNFTTSCLRRKTVISRVGCKNHCLRGKRERLTKIRVITQNWQRVKILFEYTGNFKDLYTACPVEIESPFQNI